MESEAYIELTMTLTELRVGLERTLEELEDYRQKYFGLTADLTKLKEDYERHNDVCPMGGI